MLRSLSFVKSRSRGRCRPRWCPSPALWAQRDQPASLLTCRHWANPAQTCCRHPASSAALQVRRCSVSLPLPRSSYLHTPTASPACSMTCPIHRGQAHRVLLCSLQHLSVFEDCYQYLRSTSSFLKLNCPNSFKPLLPPMLLDFLHVLHVFLALIISYSEGKLLQYAFGNSDSYKSYWGEMSIKWNTQGWNAYWQLWPAFSNWLVRQLHFWVPVLRHLKIPEVITSSVLNTNLLNLCCYFPPGSAVNFFSK